MNNKIILALRFFLVLLTSVPDFQMEVTPEFIGNRFPVRYIREKLDLKAGYNS